MKKVSNNLYSTLVYSLLSTTTLVMATPASAYSTACQNALTANGQTAPETMGKCGQDQLAKTDTTTGTCYTQNPGDMAAQQSCVAGANQDFMKCTSTATDNTQSPCNGQGGTSSPPTSTPTDGTTTTISGSTYSGDTFTYEGGAYTGGTSYASHCPSGTTYVNMQYGGYWGYVCVPPPPKPRFVASVSVDVRGKTDGSPVYSTVTGYLAPIVASNAAALCSSIPYTYVQNVFGNATLSIVGPGYGFDPNKTVGPFQVFWLNAYEVYNTPDPTLHTTFTSAATFNDYYPTPVGYQSPVSSHAFASHAHVYARVLCP